MRKCAVHSSSVAQDKPGRTGSPDPLGATGVRGAGGTQPGAPALDAPEPEAWTRPGRGPRERPACSLSCASACSPPADGADPAFSPRSEEHTSELQSRGQ